MNIEVGKKYVDQDHEITRIVFYDEITKIFIGVQGDAHIYAFREDGCYVRFNRSLIAESKEPFRDEVEREFWIDPKADKDLRYLYPIFTQQPQGHIKVKAKIVLEEIVDE